MRLLTPVHDYTTDGVGFTFPEELPWPVTHSPPEGRLHCGALVCFGIGLPLAEHS